MSKYVIASSIHKDEKKLPLYWSVALKNWVDRKLGTIFDNEQRERFTTLPKSGGWELADDGTVHYTLCCPRCSCATFEEVVVDVTVSDKFNAADLYVEEDFVELNYAGAENHGGIINRYQCASCGHVVAKSTQEFREWLKQHGNKKSK